MTVELISPTTIKVVLSACDLEEYSIDCVTLNRRSPETKQFINELTERLMSEGGIEIPGDRLFVEAFPQLSGGCLIYISARDEIRRRRGPYTSLSIFSEDFTPLYSLCRRLFEKLSHIIRGSSLYTDGIGFFLIIETFTKSEDKILALLPEYSLSCDKSEVTREYIAEHFTPFYTESAVESLYALL